MAKGQIRAVAFKEGDVWVVQGIEYDVVAQAKDPVDAPRAFLKTLISTILINQKLGRQGLESIKPAPARFAEMFEKAKTTWSALEVPDVDRGIQRPDIDLRAYSAHAH